MIFIYATSTNGKKELLANLDDAKQIHPLIAYYKKKGYSNFEIVSK
jgi:hypothetical protein